MKKRINKILSEEGIASRRAAEKLIISGNVFLNGTMVKKPGQLMEPEIDHLVVEGKKVIVKNQLKRVVYILYKPKNCICTLYDPEGRKTIKDFFPTGVKRLFPIGRLDYDAEGFIFLTNDGFLANRIMHPKFKIWKSYFVKIKGHISKKDINDLERGPRIEGKKHLPLKLIPMHKINNKMWLKISLREGTNQQIKKMFIKKKMNVLKIKRFKIGRFNLGELKPGQFRLLSIDEIQKLYDDSSTSSI